ncbi:hypothetical protein PR048_028976 [Dryococelus australis]|uniref:Uncharacterized protein n=1 Tax=Dryococelus australis TaxID=614101 RepID=A0ABQ9GC28_9NEOP|nr:hypothetical protein PR048_028976 [Dryococelus australis]
MLLVKYLFSNGCAAQFKNKITLSNLCCTKSDYGVSREWNFFTSSHGKGAVDSLGDIKRMVWLNVENKQMVVSSAKDQAVELNKEMLEQRRKTVNHISRSQSEHCLQYLENNKIVAGRTAKSELYACVVLDESCSSDLDLGMFDGKLTSSRKLSCDNVYSDSKGKISCCV